ncbi:hypothetical protein H4R34_002224 [Dimargaris verticillata]|uniref:RRM domain-containing protein n=1 Tax=Dimargaris verticillata TaxID=2761393 RepID=A0A9W8EEA0_9FUNG|nr:hypothetical protein H4R34_002224 [Dimargaris verticillata]
MGDTETFNIYGDENDTLQGLDSTGDIYHDPPATASSGQPTTTSSQVPTGSVAPSTEAKQSTELSTQQRTATAPTPDRPATLFLKNLHWAVSARDIRSALGDEELAGDITAVKFAEDKLTGKSLGTAHIIFASEKRADAALTKYSTV